MYYIIHAYIFFMLKHPNLIIIITALRTGTKRKFTFLSPRGIRSYRQHFITPYYIIYPYACRYKGFNYLCRNVLMLKCLLILNFFFKKNHLLLGIFK